MLAVTAVGRSSTVIIVAEIGNDQARIHSLRHSYSFSLVSWPILEQCPLVRKYRTRMRAETIQSSWIVSKCLREKCRTKKGAIPWTQVLTNQVRPWNEAQRGRWLQLYICSWQERKRDKTWLQRLKLRKTRDPMLLFSSYNQNGK